MKKIIFLLIGIAVIVSGCQKTDDREGISIQELEDYYRGYYQGYFDGIDDTISIVNGSKTKEEILCGRIIYEELLDEHNITCN